MDPKLTAYAIARIRAEEGSRPESERLFTDPYAHLFDDPQVHVDALFESILFFREHVRLRTRFFDDAIRSALASGVRHVVLVGAGFDCRALRMPEIAAAGARVVEVDHEAQIDAKRARFTAASVRVPEHVGFAAADLGAESLPESLPESLRQAGVTAEVPVVWVCEGLVGYLSPPAIERLAVATARSSSKGSSLVANYFTGSWSTESLSRCLQPGGWATTPGPSFEELHRRWIGDAVPSGSDMFALLTAQR